MRILTKSNPSCLCGCSVRPLLLVSILLLGLTGYSKASDTNDNYETPEKHWGTYYDPSNIFCGEYDCYKILGFDFETWGTSPPTRKEITQSYRDMSKKWHPDKNKQSGAKDRFRKINKAYEVLTENEKRKEYDYMRERPDEYFYKYGSAVIYNYAPKSDTVFVICFIILLGCAFTWFAQRNRWQQVADRVIKDAVEGNDGASTESIEVRIKAEEKLKALKGNNVEVRNGKKSKMKLTKKELRDKENEELRPIIIDLVNEIKDFGAGFHQPSFPHDVLIFKMIKWPYHLIVGILWEAKYFARRISKLELNNNEREVLTKRSVGRVSWEAASEKDREEMLRKSLWVMENLEDWLEEQEVKQLSKGEQKRYNRWKKKDGKKGNKMD